MISPEKIAEIITRVEATMCTTYSSGWTDGREEARITKEDWETISSDILTLRAERDEATRQWRNYEAAAADTLNRALAAEAQLARQGEALQTVDSLIDGVLTGPDPDDCLARLIDTVRAARAALSPEDSHG